MKLLFLVTSHFILVPEKEMRQVESRQLNRQRPTGIARQTEKDEGKILCLFLIYK